LTALLDPVTVPVTPETGGYAMKYDKQPKSALPEFHKVMPETKVLPDSAGFLPEYKQKISELGDDELGHFTVSKGDVKPSTVMFRLASAAKLLGTKIEVKVFGDQVIFYKANLKGKTKLSKVKKQE
jgi:hypothetical protein